MFPQSHEYEVVWTGTPTDLPAHFSKNVKVAASGCWEWQAAKTNGYGRYSLNGRLLMAHRYAYEQTVGPIGKGLHVDHLCRNRSCVNPNHLEPVTPRANTLRGFTESAKNVMKTHCPRGHELAGGNLLVSKDRICRTCKNERTRLWMRSRYVPKEKASHRVLRCLELNSDGATASEIARDISAPLTTVLSALARLSELGTVVSSNKEPDTRRARARWAVKS